MYATNIIGLAAAAAAVAISNIVASDSVQTISKPGEYDRAAIINMSCATTIGGWSTDRTKVRKPSSDKT